MSRGRYERSFNDYSINYQDTGCEFVPSTEELQLKAKGELKELLLSVKQGFQLLNTTGFGFQDKEMFSIRQALQIYRMVIILNSIEMMNNPTFRQWLTMSLFPNEDMFSHISIVHSSRVFRVVGMDIATTIFNLASFPIVMVFSLSEKSREDFTSFPSPFHIARATANCSTINNFPAINTKCWRFLFSKQLPHLGSCAFYAPDSVPRTKLSAINAGMFMGLLPILFTVHNNIITDFHLNVNLLISQMQGGCLNCPLPECLEDSQEEKRNTYGKVAERRYLILDLAKKGKGTSEIAHELNISERTVYRALANKSLQGVAA